VGLPDAFCWTKYGPESGESPTSILRRKESERRSNGGVFLWGVGNSIRPSLVSLLELTDQPEVIFTPIISAPKKEDALPDQVVSWRRATGIDGDPFELPPHSLVTSRAVRAGRARERHYALVCFSSEELAAPAEPGSFDKSDVRNLRTGAAVGSSQVTSVVRLLGGPSGSRYQVRIRAQLVHPYLVELTDPLWRDLCPAAPNA
jgi:hypothetical protein